MQGELAELFDKSKLDKMRFSLGTCATGSG